MPGFEKKSPCLLGVLACIAFAWTDNAAAMDAHEFQNPPNAARPRVWWHWLNGNVTKEGIARDIDWMAQSGLGGLQNFDAEMMTPQLVEKRLVYMDAGWKDAFKFAVQRAQEKDLEFGIAASPGWSETGGPWVPPADGMKKLVWTETLVEGGQPVSVKLPPLPRTSGPYQDLFVQPDIMGHQPDPAKLARFGADVGVYAYPVNAPLLDLPEIHAAGKTLDAKRLATLNGSDMVELVPPTPGQPLIVTLDYPTPRTARSATIFFPGAGTIFEAPPYHAVLEASTDRQTWRPVAELPLSRAPATAGFAPVSAAHFRIVVSARPAPLNPAFIPAAGADLGPLAAFGKSKALTLAQLRLSAEPKINQFESKAGFASVDDYLSLDGGVEAEQQGVASSAVIDLSRQMATDGMLKWTPPQGQWKIVRIGYSLTGIENHPATAEATGLEVDKYDGQAVRRYLNTYLANYRHTVGQEMMGARGLRALVTDSIEVGASNWTTRMFEQFKRLRGYDARPWLPALTGVIIESRARSDAFLYDYRRTLAELMASEHYGTVAAVAREHGLTVYGEALEGARVTLGDDMAMRSHADVPMAAMWTYRPEFGPNPTAIADIRGAASVAHLYGRKLVAAESLTSAMSPWAFAPADLRPMIDTEFVNGVNLPVIHTSVHQPLGDDKKPGLSLAIFGQYFNRNETWAGMARPWVDYMARSSYLLQQGRFYADVAYFYGEEAPLVSLYKKGQPADAPHRYAYDFLNSDTLMNQLSVRNGDFVTASGASYKVLYLGGSSHRMTLPTLRRLYRLAEQGGTIVGQAPQASLGLGDDARQFRALVAQLWRGGAVTRVGRGKVINSRDVEAALAMRGQQPDFAYTSHADAHLQFVHRRLDDGDVYFVSNRSGKAVDTEASFNVRGKVAELWHADTGLSEPVSYRTGKHATVVPLKLPANESVFVVFRKAATASEVTVPAATWSTVAQLTKGWQVRFDGLAAPQARTVETLGSLSESADEQARYFSGISIYQSSFSLPPGIQPGAAMKLDLGQVGDVAEVLVNGKPAGIVWKQPYAVEIGALAVAGDNVVEVRVANLWVNRLIGDAQPGASKVTFTSAPAYSKDAPLRPAGLIGPVTLQTPSDNAFR